METEQLGALIGDIRQSIGGKTELTADELLALNAKLAELENKLAGVEQEHPDSLNYQLTKMAADFEADHPQASRVLENMADTLAKLGI